MPGGSGSVVTLAEMKWHATWQLGHEDRVTLSTWESRNDKRERTVAFVESRKLELEKRREEVLSLKIEIERKLGEVGDAEDPEGAAKALAWRCVAKRNHEHRIEELEEMKEVEIGVTTVRRRKTLELRAGELVNVSALVAEGAGANGGGGDVYVVWHPLCIGEAGGRGVVVVEESEERKEAMERVSLLEFEPAEGVFVREWGSIRRSHTDVAVHGREVFVCDRDNARVYVFALDGKLVRQWDARGDGGRQFYYPCGLAVCGEGLVYVTDSTNHRVQVFGADGRFLRRWGAQGSGEGQFKYPYGVAVVGDEVLVVDEDNHRVQVFDTRGVFRRQFGSEGNGQGQLQYPRGIAVCGGEVFVCDYRNDRVVVFDLANGEFVRQWGEKGDGEGQFDGPDSVVVKGEEVLVTDKKNHRVQVFGLDGTFVRQWGGKGKGEGQFYFPAGLAACEGEVFVCDTRNDRVQVFR